MRRERPLVEKLAKPEKQSLAFFGCLLSNWFIKEFELKRSFAVGETAESWMDIYLVELGIIPSLTVVWWLDFVPHVVMGLHIDIPKVWHRIKTRWVIQKMIGISAAIIDTGRKYCLC